VKHAPLTYDHVAAETEAASDELRASGLLGGLPTSYDIDTVVRPVASADTSDLNFFGHASPMR
jgi:hypothetical protein